MYNRNRIYNRTENIAPPHSNRLEVLHAHHRYRVEANRAQRHLFIPSRYGQLGPRQVHGGAFYGFHAVKGVACTVGAAYRSGNAGSDLQLGVGGGGMWESISTKGEDRVF